MTDKLFLTQNDNNFVLIYSSLSLEGKVIFNSFAAPYFIHRANNVYKILILTMSPFQPVLISFVEFDQINARGQEFLWYLNIGMDSAKIRIRCGATSSKNSTDFYSFTYMFTNVK